MIKEAIQKIVKRENLTEQEANEVMIEIMSGSATESQIASYITSLRMKGETIDEITGSAKAMRQFCTKLKLEKTSKVNLDRDDVKIDYETIVDTCGTGGDASKTFNISTVVAFVVSGAGVFVAKHGNRSVSSTCGSADVIESLGIKLEISIQQAERCFSEIGIVFLFAPVWHPAMKYAIGPRRQIGIRTIFNILGPLCNPAGATGQVLGVYSSDLIKPLANVLRNLGNRHAFIVHGKDTLDEITTTNSTQVAELYNSEIKYYEITPEQFGIKNANPDDLKGGDAKQNAEIILDILNGKKGPKRDIVLLNAAAAFITADKVSNFKDGIELAKKSIDSGGALKKLNQLIEFSKSLI